MSLWDTFNGASPHTHPQASSRLSPTSLFSRLEVLLDAMADRHDAHHGDLLGMRMRDLALSRTLYANEDAENGEAIDTNVVLSRCVVEKYESKQLSGSNPALSQQEECPICLEQFKLNDKLLRLPCNHRFHIDCVVPWIRRNHDKCPFCRAKIVAMTRKNKNYLFGSSNNATETPQSHLHTNTQNAARDLSGTHRGASCNNHVNNYGTHRSTSHNPPLDNYGTPRNVPTYSNNARINRDMPMGISNVPNQTNHSHLIRIVSGTPQSLPSRTNHHTGPTNNNFGPTMRQPASRGATNQYHGPPTSRGTTNSQQSPPNYSFNVISRSGYARRHDGNILLDFGEEETPIATFTRLSFWV